MSSTERVFTEGDPTSTGRFRLLVTEPGPISVASELKADYHVVLKHGQDGWIVATCRELPAAISQGKNFEEATRNIMEAIMAVLEEAAGGKEVPEFRVVCMWE